MVRRHWIVLSGPLGAVLFLAGCLLGAFFVRRPWAVPVAGGLLLVSELWALWRWLEWRCDLWAITSQRLIDESGVLTVRLVDSPLDRIQNITCTQTLWGRMIGFGTLNVQTAAEIGSTTIESVARPVDVKEAILEAQENARHRGPDRRSGPGTAPGGPAAEGVRECPYCAETIKARAKMCRFCRRDLA